MQIREGGYYRQRNGDIRGPMKIEGEFAKADHFSLNWLLDGTCRCGPSNLDLVEEVVVFRMPVITAEDETVATEADGFILEMAMNYQADSNDDCSLFLFTQSKLLDMLKNQRDHLHRSIGVILPLETKEARDEFYQLLAEFQSGRQAVLRPVANISPDDIRTFAMDVADTIISTLKQTALRNEPLAPYLDSHRDSTSTFILGRLTDFLRYHGILTFSDGGLVGEKKGVSPEGKNLHVDGVQIPHLYTGSFPCPAATSLDARWINQFAAWNLNTFGPGRRTKGTISHIRKELDEIEANPDDPNEWADVLLLALNGMIRLPMNGQQVIETIRAKQAQNLDRVWPDWRTAPADQAIEHDRSAEVES